MEFIRKAIDIVIHLDHYLNSWATFMGGWLYGLLFVVIFCETGLVVTPFLPGDSLIFAVGALAAIEGSPLDLPLVIVLLSAAAILGDAVNYSIGLKLGPAVFKKEDSRLWNRKHLLKAQGFYEKYGGKTIFLARFVPIIRTFAPFVAGIGKMRYRRFAIYNVTGGITWVTLFALSGYWFGNIPGVRRHFQLVILAIIIISVIPAVVAYMQERRKAKMERKAQAAPESENPTPP